MDLQNASSLVIPEGNVRTIHGKNNRLLWGKLSYSTKYVGNAVQDGTPTPDSPVAIQTVTGTQAVTVCGKNLFNKSNINAVSTGATWDGEVVTSKNFSNASNVNTQIYWPSDKVIPIEKSFIVSMEIRLTSGSTGSFARIGDGYSGAFVAVEHPTITTQWQRYSYKLTPPEGFVLRALLVRMSQINGQIQIRNIQVEFGQNASEYEPYNGANYTINLGSTELCKIGDHQDYIYKNGNDWYIHKEVRKYTFASDDDWQTTSYGTNSWTLSGKFISSEYDANAVITICEIGKGVSYNNRSSGDATSTCVCFRNAGNTLTIRNTTITTQAAMQSAAAGSDFYYWAVPYDTKITDSTLISQLDSIHQFLTRYGYNATVSGNLPLIIDKTNL